jgi:hypothetical protein
MFSAAFSAVQCAHPLPKYWIEKGMPIGRSLDAETRKEGLQTERYIHTVAPKSAS